MPHTTATFGFEFKIFTWAQGLVQQMSRRQDAGFVFAFELEGIVRLTIVPVHLGIWQELRSNEHPSESYILYDLSMANCQIGLCAVVCEVLIPLPGCAISLSCSFI
jgi:hypothetical protein